MRGQPDWWRRRSPSGSKRRFSSSSRLRAWLPRWYAWLRRAAQGSLGAKSAHDHTDGAVNDGIGGGVARDAVPLGHRVECPEREPGGEARLDVGAQVAVGHRLSDEVRGESVEFTAARECCLL